MFIMQMLGWWYSRGWVWAIGSIFSQLREVNETFSIPILLRTWFSPWKQIYTPSSFRNFFQAMIDNMISRFVGAMVRSGMIVGALLASFVITLFGVVVLVLWPLIPVTVIVFPILFLGGGV